MNETVTDTKAILDGMSFQIRQGALKFANSKLFAENPFKDLAPELSSITKTFKDSNEQLNSPEVSAANSFANRALKNNFKS